MCRGGGIEKEVVGLVGALGARIWAGKGHSSPHIPEFFGRGRGSSSATQDRLGPGTEGKRCS